MTNPIIVLAPHLEFPTRNGADIYVNKLAYHLSFRWQVTILAKNEKILYLHGNKTVEYFFENQFRPKNLAGLRTLILQSNYLAERFLTSKYKKQAYTLLRESQETPIICSFISTNKIIPFNNPRKNITLTHNDEILWFQNQRKFSNNPLQKWVAFQSEHWIKKLLQYKQDQINLAHICQADFDGYKAVAPKHRGTIVPAGVDLLKLLPIRNLNGTLQLIFIGSLSVKMNYDALLFFSQQFWPIIKEKFGEKVKFQIAGSNPTNAIYKLALENQWKVYANLEDDEIHKLYRKSSLSILAFPYTTGAKLKLLNSLAAGVPVLATQNMLSSPEQNFQPNCYSDSPDEWVNHLSKYISQGISEQDRQACQKYANQFSWQKIVEEFEKTLTELGF